MIPYLQKIAILSVIKALPDWMEDTMKPGRLKTLMDRLQTETSKQLAKGRRLTDSEIFWLSVDIREWAVSNGWDKNPKHICTVTSFLIYLIVDFMPEEEKLLGLLEQIYGYFARVEKNPTACDWAGTRTAELWAGIFVNNEREKAKL